MAQPPPRAEHGAIAQGIGPLSAARVREIGVDVASLRRLEYAEDVPVSFVDAATFEERAIEGMATVATESLLSALSDTSPDDGYRQRAKYLLAIYSPKRHAVFVRRKLPDGWSAADLEGLLAHELVHSLQFQHFAPERLIEARKQQLDIDGVSALNAFLEGEAELIAAGFSAKRRGAPPRRAMIELGRERTLDTHLFAAIGQVNDALSRATSSQQANELFPYQFGPFFASALFRTGGTQLLDQAWVSPPVTSREIFLPAAYMQDAQKYEVGELPLPPGHEVRVSLTLGANGFYRIVSGHAVRSQIAPADRVFDLASYVVADRLTFASGLFGQKPLFACWSFDSVAHASEAATMLRGAHAWTFGKLLVLIEGVPDKLLEATAQRYSSLALSPVAVTGRPPPRALAALPTSASSLLKQAKAGANPLAASAALAGGLRLVGDGTELGPGDAWIAHLAGPASHVFLSLMGDGINDAAELTAAFKKGMVLDREGVERKVLVAEKYAGYTFSAERLSWAKGTAMVLDAPACAGIARVMLAFAPAPAAIQPALGLAQLRGLEGLESSPYCTRVREQHTHDVPEH